MSAINEFLDESVVLPPGDWDSKNLLSISEIQEMRKRRRERMQAAVGVQNYLSNYYDNSPNIDMKLQYCTVTYLQL